MINVYVLKGTAGKRYVGITNDLDRRIAQHKRGGTKAGHLLGDFELIHTEQFQYHTEARAREKYLKSGQGRRWLDQLNMGADVD